MAEESKQVESLATYSLLGRSGLRVSPLCLGTMTFGNPDWGSDDETTRRIYNRYIEAGGNFIDTADLYSGGRSEELIGGFLEEDGNRDSLVIATKFNFNGRPGDPNAGGNGRKHIMEAVEGSLRRLQTDYIDLYWMHAWDTMTPMEEVMQTLNALVENGKVRYIGFSDTPGWYCGAAQMLAQVRGMAPIVALQLEYSLARRDIEFEFIHAAQNLGMAITPWSPLCGGLLTGKYKRGEDTEGRLKTLRGSGNPVFDNLTERNFAIVDALVEVAEQVGRHPAQVALNWVTKRPGVGSTIFGATTMNQLESNLAALDFDIPAEGLRRLDEVSKPTPMTPYMFYGGQFFRMMSGGTRVGSHNPWYWGPF